LNIELIFPITSQYDIVSAVISVFKFAIQINSVQSLHRSRHQFFWQKIL